MPGHGGRREGAGRKPAPDPGLLSGESSGKPGPLPAADRACYARILTALHGDAPKDELREVQLWRKLIDPLLEPQADIAARRLAFESMKYLYDKRDGKAVQPVDVDASLESSVIIDLGPLMPKEFRGRAGGKPSKA